MRLRRASASNVLSAAGIGPAAPYGRLRRIENRYGADAVRYFLCVRGRFVTVYVNLKIVSQYSVGGDVSLPSMPNR